MARRIPIELAAWANSRPEGPPPMTPIVLDSMARVMTMDDKREKRHKQTRRSPVLTTQLRRIVGDNSASIGVGGRVNVQNMNEKAPTFESNGILNCSFS
jgi:hypothetical protein